MNTVTALGIGNKDQMDAIAMQSGQESGMAPLFLISQYREEITIHIDCQSVSDARSLSARAWAPSVPLQLQSGLRARAGGCCVRGAAQTALWGRPLTLNIRVA